jgi:3-oxoacyl-[acyl-carrier-protein] synthase-1
VFGEGAGVVVIERRSSAEARRARVLGRLLGWGMSSDGAGDMVAPCADGALSAMRGAVRHARLGPDDIDYVNTHATSTPVGDLSEVRAMRALFGGRRVPYSSTKGFTGHTISAAGALEAVLTWTMLGQSWLAPALHAEPVDAELVDWPPVLHPTPSTAAVALSNSFGFGGTNVSLVLGAP